VARAQVRCVTVPLCLTSKEGCHRIACQSEGLWHPCCCEQMSQKRERLATSPRPLPSSCAAAAFARRPARSHAGRSGQQQKQQRGDGCFHPS
jgi:hypothetical protein